MNLVGKWKVKELLQFSLENGMEWKPVDEVIDANADEDEEEEGGFNAYRDTITSFNEDGTVDTLAKAPEGYLEAAQANGEEVTLRDGMVVISTNSWKTEDGKNYYNTGIQGEVLGEEVSPWQEIVEVGEMIEFSMVRYARAE